MNEIEKNEGNSLNSPSRINVIIKAMHIINLFDNSQSEWSLAQLSNESGYPKSTIFGILRTLEEEGYIERVNNTQNYRLGLKFLEKSFYVRSSLPIIQYAMPLLEELNSTIEQNVYLTTHRNGRLLFLESSLLGRQHIKYSVSGKVLPMHCTGSGKAMMSYMTEEQVKKIVQTWGLTSSTPNTITEYQSLMQELEETRNRGYAVDNEEESFGVKCIATAIRNAQGQPVGCVSISGSIFSVTAEKVVGYAEQLSKISSVLSEYANLFPVRYL